MESPIDKSFEGRFRAIMRELTQLDRRLGTVANVRNALTRHVTDNPDNGRAYFGTGSTATNENGTYMGASPVGGNDEANKNAFWFQTSAGQVLNITKDGHIQSSMSGALSWAVAAGTFTLADAITTNTYVDTTVTFPSGRFSVTPRVSGFVAVGPGSVRSSISALTISATSMNVRVFNATTGGSISAGTRIDWTVTQMRETNGSG